MRTHLTIPKPGKENRKVGQEIETVTMRTLRPKVKPSAKIYQRKPRIGESSTMRAIDALAATLRRECPLADLFEAVRQTETAEEN